MFAYHQEGVLIVILIIAFPLSYRYKSEALIQVLGTQVADPHLQRGIAGSEIGQNLQQIRETLALGTDTVLIPFSAEKGDGREALMQELGNLL